MLREPEYIPPRSTDAGGGANVSARVVSSVVSSTQYLASALWSGVAGASKWVGLIKDTQGSRATAAEMDSLGAVHLRWRPKVQWCRLQLSDEPGVAFIVMVYRYGGIHIWNVQDDAAKKRFYLISHKLARQSLPSTSTCGTSDQACMNAAHEEDGGGDGSSDDDSIGSSPAGAELPSGLSINETLCLSSVEGFGTPALAHMMAAPSAQLSLDVYVKTVMDAHAERRKARKPSTEKHPGNNVVAALRRDKERSYSEESVKSNNTDDVSIPTGIHEKIVDSFAEHRPLMAVAVQAQDRKSNGKPQPKEILIFSLQSKTYIHSLRFRSPICGIHSNSMVLIVVCLDVIYGFSNHSLELCFRLPTAAFPYGDGFAAVCLSNRRSVGEDEKGDFLVFCPPTESISTLKLQAVNAAVSLNDGTDAPAALVVGGKANAVGANTQPKLDTPPSNLSFASMPATRDVLKSTVATMYNLRDAAIEKVVSVSGGTPKETTKETAVIADGSVAAANLLQLAGDFALWRTSVETLSAMSTEGDTSNTKGKVRSKSAVPFTPRVRLMQLAAGHPATLALDATGTSFACSDLNGQAAYVFRMTFPSGDSTSWRLSAPAFVPQFVCERGVTMARITRLSFSIGANVLAVTSDRGTVHLYPLLQQTSLYDPSKQFSRLYAVQKLRHTVEPTGVEPEEGATNAAHEAFQGYGAAMMTSLAGAHIQNKLRQGTIAQPEVTLLPSLVVPCDNLLLGDYNICVSHVGRLQAHELEARARTINEVSNSARSEGSGVIGVTTELIHPSASSMSDALSTSTPSSYSGSIPQVQSAQAGPSASNSAEQAPEGYMASLLQGVANIADGTLQYLKQKPQPDVPVSLEVSTSDLGSWDVRRQSHWPDICVANHSATPPQVSGSCASYTQLMERCSAIDSEVARAREILSDFEPPASFHPSAHADLPLSTKVEAAAPHPFEEPHHHIEQPLGSLTLPEHVAPVSEPHVEQPAPVPSAPALDPHDLMLAMSLMHSQAVPRHEERPPFTVPHEYYYAAPGVVTIDAGAAASVAQGDYMSSSLINPTAESLGVPDDILPPATTLSPSTDNALDMLQLRAAVNADPLDIRLDAFPPSAAPPLPPQAEPIDHAAIDAAEFDRADDAAPSALATVLEECRKSGAMPPEEALDVFFAGQHFPEPAPPTMAASVRMKVSKPAIVRVEDSASVDMSGVLEAPAPAASSMYLSVAIPHIASSTSTNKKNARKRK